MESMLAEELAGLGFLDVQTLTKQPSLLNAVSSHSYQPGEVIYHSGDPSLALFIISNGLIKLVSYLPNGRTRIVRLHRRGSMIGLHGLMAEHHEHTAIAIDEVTVYQVPHSELQSWKEKIPQIYSQLLENCYACLRYADIWITDFSTGSVKGRVARLIRFLAQFDEQTGPKVVELLTTDDMAEILGVTPESVSRVVAEFKREGVLSAIENNTESLFTFDRRKLSLAAEE